MAAGELSRPASPRIQADPRHAWRQGLRRSLGHEDERYRPLCMDDWPPLRNGLRKARDQSVAHAAHDRAFPQATFRSATVGPFRRMSEPDALLSLVTLGVANLERSIVFY